MNQSNLQKDPRKYWYNTPKEQVAERLNQNEEKRLDLQTRFYMRQKQHSEHIMNMRINRVQELLDQIPLSSGTLSGEEFFESGEEVTAPCYMYGERVESRRRYSKRVALLRFFLERRPKSPQGQGRKDAFGTRPQRVDSRSADVIFEEILRKIESECKSEEKYEASNNDDDDKVAVEEGVKLLEVMDRKPRCGSAIAVDSRTRLALPGVTRTKERPRTAPCWESRTPSRNLSPSWIPTLSASTYSIGDVADDSRRIQFFLEDEVVSSKLSARHPGGAYIPYWADLDPVTHNDLRSSRGKSHSIVSSSSSMHRSVDSAGQRGRRDRLMQPSLSSITSETSNSSQRPKFHSSRSLASSGQTKSVDSFFHASHSKSRSSHKATESDEKKPVDAFFAGGSTRTLSSDDQDCLEFSGSQESIRPFKRPTIYAPTIASRQRTISSLMVIAAKRTTNTSS